MNDFGKQTILPSRRSSNTSVTSIACHLEAFWPFAVRYVVGLWCRSECGSSLACMCHPWQVPPLPSTILGHEGWPGAGLEGVTPALARKP